MAIDPVKLIIFISVLTGACCAHSAQSVNNGRWLFKNRIQCAVEYDSNVEERLNAPEEGHSFRTALYSKVQKNGKRILFHFCYQGGFQLYPSFDSENKSIHEIKGRMLLKLSPFIYAGVHVFGRLKMFINADTDYSLGEFSPFIQWRYSPSVVFETGFRQDDLNYRETDYYDFKSPQLYFQLTKKIGRFTFSPDFRFGTIDHNRMAYEPAPDMSDWVLTDDSQNDKCKIMGLNTDWIFAGFLVNASYHYEQNRSNSYGFDFDRHIVTVMLAKSFGKNLFRGFITMQNKSYLDDFLPLLPVDLDTEKEQSNFFVFDYSRDVMQNLAIMFRSAWYKNESPLPSLYYEKWLFNLGFEFQIPVKVIH